MKKYKLVSPLGTDAGFIIFIVLMVIVLFAVFPVVMLYIVGGILLLFGMLFGGSRLYWRIKSRK